MSFLLMSFRVPRFIVRKEFNLYVPVRNENGRTPTVTFTYCDGHWSTSFGELLDSEKDRQSCNVMNDVMKQVRRDFIYKSAKSKQSAAEVVFTA